MAKPRAKAFPGMEDSAIEELEAAADDFLDARESAARIRREAREQAKKIESAAEQKCLEIMAEHGKETYKRNLEDGMTLDLKVKGEKHVLCRKTKTRSPKAKKAA